MDLPHPPLSYVGDVPFNANENVTGSLRVRHADGSLNNPFMPSFGKAGTRKLKCLFYVLCCVN